MRSGVEAGAIEDKKQGVSEAPTSWARGIFPHFSKGEETGMRKNQDLTMASTEVRGEAFGRSLGLMMGKMDGPYTGLGL